MGEVWLAEHPTHWVQVAIKLLHGPVSGEQSASQFANEVAAIAALRHPGIVMVLDHGRVEAQSPAARAGRFAPGTPYLVMERVKGVPLRHYSGRLGWHAAREVLLQLLDALAHSHARGVIHRDLKPGNVLLRRELSTDPDYPGHRGLVDALLSDFGIATAATPDVSGEGEIAGTPAYMAPEQLRGRLRDQGPWTDLYALGCLAWELVTGEPPFGRTFTLDEALQAHTRAPIPRLRPAVAVPPDLEAWLLRLLSRPIGERYHHAADAAYGLLSLTDDLRASWMQLAFREGGLANVDVIDASTWRRAEPPTMPSQRALVAIDLPTLTHTPRPAARDDDPSALPALDRPRLPLATPPLPASWRGPQPPPAPTHLLGIGLNLFSLRARPFVGREKEMDRLWSALRAVHRGDGARALLIFGPSGCGKSHLAGHLCERAQEVGGAQVLRWRCTPDLRAPDPIAGLAAQILRAPSADRERLRAQLKMSLGPYGLGEDDDLLAYGELIAPQHRSQKAGPQVLFRVAAERTTLLLRLLRAVAASLPSGGRPLVLHLDDAHHSTDAFALTQAILAESATLPLLILLSGSEQSSLDGEERAADLAALLAHPRVERIDLGPLAPAAHELLVSQLLGMEGELVSQVARRTAGNPAFAVALIGDWVDRGVLEAGPHGFRLRDESSVPLPADAAEAWRRRCERLCDQLSKTEALALEVAAVLGHEVDEAEWLDATARTGVPVQSSLVDRLLRARVITLREEGGGWTFTQPMLREALEEQAQRARRLSRIHQAAASLLTARPRRDAQTAERLGRHLLLAGWPGPAMEELLRAAQLRADLREHGAALRILDLRERALRRLRLPTEDEVWGQGWALRCQIARTRPDPDLALQIGERALQSATRHGWPQVEAQLLCELVPIHLARRETAKAAAAISRIDELSRLLSDEARADHCLLFEGRLLVELAQYARATELIRGARSRFLSRGRLTEVAQCHALLARIARAEGRLADARSQASEALHHSRLAGDRLGIAEALLIEGELFRLQHDVDAAQSALAESARRYADLGQPEPLALAYNLAMLPLQRGQYAHSGPLLAELLRAARAAADPTLSTALHAALLLTAAAEADWAAFDEHYRQTVLLLDAHPQAHLDIARAARIAGDIARNEPARARKALTLAWHQWRGLGRIPEAAAVQARLATLGPLRVVDAPRETQ
jgi:serine/threonine protein kinase